MDYGNAGERSSMTILTQSRLAFAMAFLTALFCFSAWNLRVQGPDMLQELSDRGVPRSVQEVRDAAGRAQTLVAQKLEGKYAAWEAHAWLQQALGKSEVNDFSVIKAADGRLYRGGLYPLDLENVRSLAEDIAELAEAAAATGAKTLYLNTPDAVIKGAAPQPASMPYRDYNTASDALLNELREKGVQHIDARYSFLADAFPPEAIWPKTSLVLSGEGAFAVFGCLIEGLEQKFGLSLDPDGFYRSISNYAVRMHPDFFIGELGKETGPAFSGLDDFTSVEPAFETDFDYEAIDMFGKTSRVRGNAASALLQPNALVYYENLYRLYPQSYYKHANVTWSKIVNRRKPDGPKALVIHDQYAAQVISHLAPLFGETHTLAYQKNLPDNAMEYIRDHSFDCIIITFAPQNLIRPETRLLISGAK